MHRCVWTRPWCVWTRPTWMNSCGQELCTRSRLIHSLARVRTGPDATRPDASDLVRPTWTGGVVVQRHAQFDLVRPDVYGWVMKWCNGTHNPTCSIRTGPTWCPQFLTKDFLKSRRGTLFEAFLGRGDASRASHWAYPCPCSFAAMTLFIL